MQSSVHASCQNRGGKSHGSWAVRLSCIYSSVRLEKKGVNRGQKGHRCWSYAAARAGLPVHRPTGKPARLPGVTLLSLGGPGVSANGKPKTESRSSSPSRFLALSPSPPSLSPPFLLFPSCCSSSCFLTILLHHTLPQFTSLYIFFRPTRTPSQTSTMCLFTLVCLQTSLPVLFLTPTRLLQLAIQNIYTCKHERLVYQWMCDDLRISGRRCLTQASDMEAKHLSSCQFK